jgi:hypothetical protein
LYECNELNLKNIIGVSIRENKLTTKQQTNTGLKTIISPDFIQFLSGDGARKLSSKVKDLFKTIFNSNWWSTCIDSKIGSAAEEDCKIIKYVYLSANKIVLSVSMSGNEICIITDTPGNEFKIIDGAINCDFNTTTFHDLSRSLYDEIVKPINGTRYYHFINDSNELITLCDGHKIIKAS